MSVEALLTQVLNRLSVIESKLGVSSPTSSNNEGQNIPPSIKAFDEYCSSYLDPFDKAAVALGGEAKIAGDIIVSAWKELKAFLIMASQCKEPTQAILAPLLSSISAKMKEASTLVKRNEWEKHTKTCSEGIGCLNWILVKPAPRDFIESYIGGSDYWANGIRKEFKGVNPAQIAFCDTFKTLLLELMVYVKAYHTTGVVWNPKGVDVSEYNPNASSSTSSTSSSTSAPTVVKGPSTTSSAPKADLFSALNKGGAITGGLKTVTKDMQTWRSEYKPVDPTPSATSTSTSGVVKKPTAEVVMKGPPKLEFDPSGSKWSVEYQSDKNGIVNVTIGDKKETVYVYGCVGATIDVKGKCKSVVVDGCKKVTVLFDNIMASCEVVNCQRMNIICRESVSAVAIDKTDGIVVTLPTSSLHTEVVASKSSEMNLSWPDANGDLVEKPIPEQYVHRIKGMSITADVSDLYGH